MRALITGATGLLGDRLVRRLLADGDEVVVVGRDVGRLEAHFAAGAEPALAARVRAIRKIGWDGVTLAAKALEGVDVVYHLAGESVADGRWTDARKARIRESRVASTRSIVGAMREAREAREAGETRGSAGGERVLVCASAVGVYGARGDETLTEQSAPAPDARDFLAGVCVEWEAEARAAEAFGARVASVRIGIVLAKDGGALGKMLPLFRAGLGGRLGDGRQWMSWIHVDDVVGIFRHAAREGAVRGPINAVAPAPVTNADFTRALARALHRPAFLPAPSFALRAALGEMSEVVLASQRVLPAVAQRTGYAFRHETLDGALAQVLGRGVEAASGAEGHA